MIFLGGYAMENELLALIQQSFPLVPRPFEKLAQMLGMREEEVISLYSTLKDQKIIRQTSAIFDTKSLGYESTLVAFKIDPENLDAAANIINSHPGVSHNYERDHDFNLWFTLAVPPDSALGLEGTISLLAKRTKAKEYIILPTLKMFKISVQLDTTKKREKKESVVKKEIIPINLTRLHYDLIDWLQNDIEAVAEPFKPITQKLEISYDELFKMSAELERGGYMRRFASILNHRKAGFHSNAMVVWSIPEEQAEASGHKIAAFSSVSHCYLRPSYPNWPYNLFSMIHTTSDQETEKLIEEMAKEIGAKEYRPLYSLREFKKKRIRYFSPDIYEWERAMKESM